jgi:hypothetical protein
MEIVTSIVDGIVAIIQSIIFGAVIIACFYIVMKYKSKKPVVVEAKAEETPKAKKPVFVSEGDDGEEEFYDITTGELIVKKKARK